LEIKDSLYFLEGQLYSGEAKGDKVDQMLGLFAALTGNKDMNGLKYFVIENGKVVSLSTFILSWAVTNLC